MTLPLLALAVATTPALARITSVGAVVHPRRHRRSVVGDVRCAGLPGDGLKTTRYFFPWNGMDNPYELTKATQYADRAKAGRVSVLFHLSTETSR